MFWSQVDFIVEHVTRDAGPAIIKRDKHIHLAFHDHLRDSNTWEHLNVDMASVMLHENRDRSDEWFEDHKTELTDQEHGCICHAPLKQKILFRIFMN